MRVKRFIGPTMRDATAQVWREFGPNALIMRTERVRQPGAFGWFRPRWVAVLAGLDEKAATPPAPEMNNRAPLPAPAPVSDGKLTALAVAHLLKRLREQEVAEEYLVPLAEKLEERVGHSGEAPQRHLLSLLQEELPVGKPWPVAQEQPLVVPLVGPTGVGKTTTIAKLAAHFSLEQGQRVGLITADTYRIAAVEQLRTYADILSLPLEVVYSPAEMKEALRQLAKKDLILVDTAGRSPHHDHQMEELQALLQAAGSAHAHLVLSATTRHRDMAEIADRFNAGSHLAGLIITKLDETGTYGLIYNATRRTGLPLAYVASGQGVPEDLARADAAELARRIVGVET